MQIARNITDVDDGFLRGKRYLILDRDAKYSDGFRSLLVREGIRRSTAAMITKLERERFILPPVPRTPIFPKVIAIQGSLDPIYDDAIVI